MTEIAHGLKEALQGGVLAVLLLRLAFAFDASPVLDLAHGYSEPAGLLPHLVGLDLFLNAGQANLLRFLCALVIGVGLAWATAATLAARRARA